MAAEWRRYSEASDAGRDEYDGRSRAAPCAHRTLPAVRRLVCYDPGRLRGT